MSLLIAKDWESTILNKIIKEKQWLHARSESLGMHTSSFPLQLNMNFSIPWINKMINLIDSFVIHNIWQINIHIPEIFLSKKKNCISKSPSVILVLKFLSTIVCLHHVNLKMNLLSQAKHPWEIFTCMTWLPNTKTSYNQI